VTNHDYVTVITASTPVKKRYVQHPNGRLEKIAAATLIGGVAQSFHVPDVDAMAKVVEEVAESDDKVMVPGRWRGDDGTPFNIVTKAELSRLLGVIEENLPNRVVEVDGKRYAARIKGAIEASSLQVLDADSPEGIPPEWEEMDAAQRLSLYEKVLPGISKVSRVEVRSSSARVRRPNEPRRGASHLWVKLSDPSKLDILRRYVNVAQVNAGLSFACPHRSRTKPDQIVGRSHRGLFDTSVWAPGRLVFGAKPDVTAAPDFVCDDADVAIVDGKPSLDISGIREPDVEALLAYRARTNISRAFHRSRSGGLSEVSRGELTWDTEIEARGQIKTLREWAEGMKPGEKLRCEAPFRVSSSEAAFVALDTTGEPFVYDSGTATTYRLASAASYIMDELNARYSFVNEGGKARVYERKRSPLRGEYYESSVAADFKLMHDNRQVEVGQKANGRPRYMGAGSYWMKYPDRRQYLGGVVFDPTGKQTSPDQLNIWMGFGVEARRGGSWDLLKRHIRDVICGANDVYFGYLLSWMARVVQFPAEAGEVAVVLCGGEGTGKGTLANAMAHILGSSAFATSRSNDVVGRFNDQLRGCVFLFCDEAFFAANRQDADALKTLVTEPKFSSEGKGAAILQWPNYLHIMMASNADWVVNASLDSRRYFVLKVQPLTVDRNDAYFAAIRAELAEGGYEAMLYDLLHHDLTGFNVRDFPKTGALVEQRLRSLTGPEAWWYDVLARGRLLDGSSHEWEPWLSTTRLYEDYLTYARRQRYGSGPVNEATLGKFLKKWGTAHRPSGKARGYHFGPLALARTAFCEETGLPDEWEPD
jgi:hypothetical protein